MSWSLCKKNYLLEKDDEAIQSQNKIPDDKNPKYSFSKNNDIRMFLLVYITKFYDTLKK